MQAKTKIQNAIFSLLKTEPYYANFILDCKIMYDTLNVTRACVGVAGGVPVMVFNSEFLAKHTDLEVAAILKHEVCHLLFDHLDDMKDTPQRDILNIAQDTAINQYIKDLPKDCWDLAGLSKVVGKPLKAFETSKYYYDQLLSKAKELAKAGVGTLDEHGVEIPGQDAKEIAKGVVAKVGQNALNRAAGNAPDFVVKAIENLREAKLPWKSLLRNAIMSQVSRETQSTHKKVNRRFALPVPGKRHKRTMTLGVCLDSSGSVSDEQFSEFMAEVKSIAKTVDKTWLIHADCQVQSVEDLSKSKLEFKRKGNGGTAYQPAITKCKELKCNMILYFGDFDTADKPQNPGVPFIWIGVGNQEPPGNFGKVIRL